MIAAYVVVTSRTKIFVVVEGKNKQVLDTLSFPLQKRPHSARSVKTSNLCLYLLGGHLDICRGKKVSLRKTKTIFLKPTFGWI